MDVVAVIGDLVAIVTFLVAIGIVIATPSGQGSPMASITKWLLITAFATRAYVSATKVYATYAGPNFFEDFGDYIEVLFPVMVTMSVASAFMAQKMEDLDRSQRAMLSANEMMLDMVDAAPAGILVLDGAGNITFANDSARHTLDLEENPDTGGLTTPGWTIRDPSGVSTSDFSFLVNDTSARPVKLRVEWPDSAWKIDLTVSARPLQVDGSRSDGLVATFESPAAKP
ncbi:MAG: PAS domain-containing protein [Coriobacteriia bacterium]